MTGEETGTMLNANPSGTGLIHDTPFTTPQVQLHLQHSLNALDPYMTGEETGTMLNADPSGTGLIHDTL